MDTNTFISRYVFVMVMAESETPRLTVMESKILRLGMKQHEKGYAGGTITPGFVRKETEYSYRAINMALESLINQELMEKSLRSTFRDGSLVELDVYKITYRGIETIEQLDAGTITVTGTEPEPERTPRREYDNHSKPWDRPRQEYRPRQPETQRAYRPQEPHTRELIEAMNALHSAMKLLSEDVKGLHAKVDRLMAHGATQAPAKATARKGVAKANDHTILVLGSVNALAPVRDFVIADEVRSTYFRECERLGLKPKGQSQFTAYLKRLESKGLLELRRMGCRNLGIKGHGSRVVVTLSKEGSEYLAQHSAD
jgi:hypothetical protein